MKNKKIETFIIESFGFPVQLVNVPMKYVAGEWMLDINFNELQKAVLRLLIFKLTPLTGAELRFIRKYLNLSTIDFGKIFAVTHPAVLKWEKEQARVPAVTDFYVRLYMLAHLHASNEELRALYDTISPESLSARKEEENVPISVHVDENLRSA